MCCLYLADVYGVTQLADVVYTVCPFNLSDERSTIWQFSATSRERLTNIEVVSLGWSRDIAACVATCQLYVADYVGCVWQVSARDPSMQSQLPQIRSVAVMAVKVLFIKISVSVTSLLADYKHDHLYLSLSLGVSENKLNRTVVLLHYVNMTFFHCICVLVNY